MEKIPLGTEYVTFEDLNITTPTPEQEMMLLMANTSIDLHCSTMTYYDEQGEIPFALKQSAIMQYNAIFEGELSMIDENVSGSSSIGSWSESGASVSNSKQDIGLCKNAHTLLKAYGYLYRGNVTVI